MSTEQCPRCKTIGIGAPTPIGVPVQCRCLPSGKTCKDCKFEANCLIEQVITKISGTYCEYEGLDRSFALPGELSYREMWANYWAEEERQSKEERKREAEELRRQKEARQRQLAGHVWTQNMIVEGILPHRLREVHTELPPGGEPNNEVGWYFQTFLEEYETPHEAAYAYLNRHAPAWRRRIGDYLPEHLRGVFAGELGNREVSDRLERTKCAAPTI